MDHLDHSLAEDLEVFLRTSANRRKSLRWLLCGAAGVGIAACGGGSSGSSASTMGGTAASTSNSTSTATTGATSSTSTAASTSTSSSTGSTGTATSTATSCAVIPEETGGPYPGDGTNSNGFGVADALLLSGIVREDIRSSIGSASGVAAGVPLTIKLQLVNVNASCASLAGAAIYLWHCTREGGYSMYSTGITSENYLRGVQEADRSGMVTFTTIFPGCYSGRMPHVHLEVYPTLAKSTDAANRIKTTQFTFPMATLNEVYATAGYSASIANLAQTSYATDLVFSDGTSLQMGSVTGDPVNGYVVTLQVGVSM